MEAILLLVMPPLSPSTAISCVAIRLFNYLQKTKEQLHNVSIWSRFLWNRLTSPFSISVLRCFWKRMSGERAMVVTSWPDEVFLGAPPPGWPNGKNSSVGSCCPELPNWSGFLMRVRTAPSSFLCQEIIFYVTTSTLYIPHQYINMYL